MVKNVNSVVHCSISQKAHIQTSEVHQGASISAWGIPRADLGGAGGGTVQGWDRQKTPHPFVTAETETAKEWNSKRTEGRYSSNLVSMACFFGEWQSAEEVNVSLFPCQKQLTDPLTSFGWHCAVASPSHTQGREAGAAHKSQDEMITNVPQRPQARCTDPHFKVTLCYRQSQPTSWLLP